MLSNLEYHGTIPAGDLKCARHFYEDRLGFKAEESQGGLIMRRKNSWFLV